MLDPVLAKIAGHRQAWHTVQSALHLDDPSAAAPTSRLDREEAKSSLAGLVAATRELTSTRATTLAGLSRLLEYLTGRLVEPGAPSLPLEFSTVGMSWEAAVSDVLAGAAGTLVTIMTVAGTEAGIDAVADAIVIASEETFEDFAVARKAALAALVSAGLVEDDDESAAEDDDEPF
jgi:hypothetical protein